MDRPSNTDADPTREAVVKPAAQGSKSAGSVQFFESSRGGKSMFDRFDGQLLVTMRPCEQAYSALTKAEETPTVDQFTKISNFASRAASACAEATATISKRADQPLSEAIPNDVGAALTKAAEDIARAMNQKAAVADLTRQMLANPSDAELPARLKAKVDALNPMVMEGALALAYAREKMSTYAALSEP
jgi:hypothetical protein